VVRCHIVALILVDDRKIAHGRTGKSIFSRPQWRWNEFAGLNCRIGGLEKGRGITVRELPKDRTGNTVDTITRGQASIRILQGQIVAVEAEPDTHDSPLGKLWYDRGCRWLGALVNYERIVNRN